MIDYALNLWDADEYGDGEVSGPVLTAYPLDEQDGIISNRYVSVSVSKEDLPFNDKYVVDDDWFYGGTHYNRLTKLFINNLIKEKYGSE